MFLKRGAIIFVVLFSLGIFALVIARGQEWMINRDFFTYWAGGRGLLDGKNLYDSSAWWSIHQTFASAWFPNPVFIYAPPTAIFFAPLAALQPQVAGFIWIWLSEIFVVFTLVIIAKNLRWQRGVQYMPFWIPGILFFLPVLLTFLMGQASGLLLILVVVVAALWEQRHWLAGGLILGFTIVKPQPIAFLLPMLALWLLLNRRWYAFLGLGLSLSVMAAAGLILFPNFIWDWQNAVLTKVGGVAGRMPTIWGLSADLFGASPFAVLSGATLALVALATSVKIIAQEKSALIVTSVLLIPSISVTPYLWNYDQILLLLPLLVALISMDQRGVSAAIILLLLFAVDALAIVFLEIASVRLRDTLSVLLPVFVGLVLWTALRKPKVLDSPRRDVGANTAN